MYKLFMSNNDSRCEVLFCYRVMIARFEYLLMDKLKNKSPSRVPAKTYVDNMFNWAVHLLEDEHIFPPEKGR